MTDDERRLIAHAADVIDDHACCARGNSIADMRAALAAMIRAIAKGSVARPIDEWHEDNGPALWWRFPIDEPPYSGSPLDDDWPGYHTHWTAIVCPSAPSTGGAP